MSAQDEDPTHLSDAAWEWVSLHMPIPCADILPVVKDDLGQVLFVGLILRDFGDRRVWCQLGGRVLYQETMAQCARRHLDATLRAPAGVVLASQPYFVNQYLPTEVEGYGFDPRKHAIAACFLCEFPEAAALESFGEAKEFRWFKITDQPEEGDLWPGTRLMLDALAASHSWSNPQTSFDALNARYLSHNELMWQTPGLAMTAMAFLLTISLGGATSWARALASGLSFVIAVVSIQLMAKHSYFQIADADQLWEIEKALGMMPLHAPPGPVSPRLAKGNLFIRTVSRIEGRLVRYRSRQWWLAALALFACVSLAALILAIAGV